MSDNDFDTALITAAFRIAADQGWGTVTVAAAARAAGLSLAEARARFPSRAAILLRFGRLADQLALADAPANGPVRDRLFDLLMRRFDALQAQREGIRALIRALPFEPLTALMLASANTASMRWMLQAAGIAATGLRGDLQAKGLDAVWLYALRAWDRDESEDLSGTMAAVDKALEQAEQMASWLHGPKPDAAPPPPPPVNPGAGMIDPTDPPASPPAAPATATIDPTDPPASPPPAAPGTGMIDPMDLPALPPPSPPAAPGTGMIDPPDPPASAI